MDVMVLLTSRDSAPLVVPLMRALDRAGASWGCFLTNDGVDVLRQPDAVAAMQTATQAVACELSWEKNGGTIDDCPVELGSQTINSAMIGTAHRVISL